LSTRSIAKNKGGRKDRRRREGREEAGDGPVTPAGPTILLLNPVTEPDSSMGIPGSVKP
jgi:hypothetical protein